jgi:hypothetical protein
MPRNPPIFSIAPYLTHPSVPLPGNSLELQGISFAQTQFYLDNQPQTDKNENIEALHFGAVSYFQARVRIL